MGELITIGAFLAVILCFIGIVAVLLIKLHYLRQSVHRIRAAQAALAENQAKVNDRLIYIVGGLTAGVIRLKAKVMKDE